jgi:hypothetical protein
MGAAPTEYAVATPVRPDAYQPHMAEDVRVRKLIVRDGLFCDSDGTPHNSDDYEYFLIGVQPDDFRVVGPGDFPEDEVDDDSYDFVHPHDIVFCSYADPGDGPIGAGHWRRMVNGVPQETLLTCRAFPDTLEERVKFVMQTLHWLSGHGMDLAAINLSGTFHGTIFRLSAPLHSAAELISQDYAHPESVFACATTQFWVYPAVVESTPARLSVSLPVTLLNGTSVEHTMTLTRHGDTITASFTEPTHSPGATEAAAAWTQLRSELIDPWLANSNVVVTVDISASVAATDEAAHEEQPGRTDSGAMSSADEVPDMPDAADQRTPQDRRVYHRLLAQLGDPRTARDLAARAHSRAEREQPPTDPDAAAEHLLHIADTILAEHRAAMAQLDDVVGDQPALRQQRLTNPQHGGVFFHNQPDEPQDAVGTDDVPAEPNPHRLTDREIEIEHERSETERARVDLARALGVDPRIVELRGALLQVLDQAQMELRLLSDEDWPRIQPEKLPGWLGRALDREYRAQRAMSDGATAEELARLDADTRQLEADLATILGQDQLAPGWRAADSDDKLHELRRLATRANAPREIADLVDAAARFLGLARPTPPATDSPAVAGARASIRELLTAEADIAAAEEMLDALVRTAEGPVAVRVRPEGTERVRVEVLDHSRIVPVRDEPDESTGEVMPTEAGEVTALLDKSGRWGFRIHTNGSRTRWFAAGQTQAVPVSTEPAVRMRFERGQVRQGVARARRDVGRFLSHNTRMPQTTIDAAVLALSELLGNSAQYAKQGGAEVTVEADDTRVRIGITDTSLGLPKWRIESDVDPADEVAPSPTIDLDSIDALLAGIDLAALDSARTDPDELGNRAEGEHGRGARIVWDKAFAVGTDLTRHGKTVWVEYRTPPRSYPASLDDALDLPRGSATRADGAVMAPSPWTKRGQTAEGPLAFSTPPGDTPGVGSVGSRPHALHSAVQAAQEAIRIEDENGRTLDDYRIEVIDGSTTEVSAGPQSASGAKTGPKNYPASLDDVFDLAPGRVSHADGTPIVLSPWAKRGSLHEGPSAFSTPPGGVSGVGRSQSRSEPEVHPSAESAPENEADLEAEIGNRLSALGIETRAALLLEASLSLEEKFLGIAIIAGQPRPEVIFGKRRWAGHLGARLVARQHGNQELTVDFILELDRALTLSENLPKSREIPEPRSRVGILYSELTSDQVAAIDENPLLVYLPPPAGPGDYGVIKYPDFDSPEDLRRELQALCDWYNAAKRESSYDPYELAASLQRWFVSVHPVEHKGQASRILMHWSLEQDGKFPSAVREFDSLLDRPSDWVATVRAGTLRYGEMVAKLGERGPKIDPVTLFGYEQQRENYRGMNSETAPFAPGQPRDRMKYTRLWKSVTSGETRPETSGAVVSPPVA